MKVKELQELILLKLINIKMKYRYEEDNIQTKEYTLTHTTIS